jgi:putative methionine-R-sulfoxide reductase with GAF domain
MVPGRDYGACERAVGKILTAGSTMAERMLVVVDVLWSHLEERNVAWLGFYEISDAGDEMLLRVCRPKPACSPIGLHGVCGKSWREKLPQVVDDVHAMGADHIVCDPANRSEVVVPCLDEERQCWGVLDLDSRQLAAFTTEDAEGLRRVLRAARLTV